MSTFDLNDIVQQARTGNASEPDLQRAYDQVAQSSPGNVREGLAEAFRSDRTPDFPQMVANLFGRSDPNQKAGLLNTLLGKLNPMERKAALGPVAETTGAASGQVTPDQAQQIQPPQVATLADHAQRKDPSVMDQAAAFYAQHPTLVKGLGAAALAILLSRATQARH
jgi:hypothetical protein